MTIMYIYIYIYIYTHIYLYTRICIGVGYWSLSLRSHVISNRRLYVIRVATLIYVKRKLYYSLTVESKCFLLGLVMSGVGGEFIE